jgi:hypothetical protein
MDPKQLGYSLVQLIETSAITGHFCDRSGDAYELNVAFEMNLRRLTCQAL